MLTKEIADEILRYDPESGKFFYKKSTNSRNKIGQEAGSLSLGYLCIMYKGKNYRLHRIVFLLETGEWPKNQVDHINGIRSDNRRSNLREVTNQQNSWNKESIGVLHQPRSTNHPYCAYIDMNRKRTYLGSFKTFEEAREISRLEKQRLRGIYVRD